MSTDTSVPKYRQIMEDIKGSIESGEFSPESRIPAEPELVARYGVGRVTVRHAIEELVSQGYLSKQQGRGTFVKAAKLTRKVHQKADVESFSDACRENGMNPGARLISRRVVAAGPEEAGFFGVPEGTDLICIERLRTADGIAVMLENNTLPLAGFEFLREVNLNDCSLFEAVREGSGRVPVTSARCILTIERASTDAASKLRIPVGEPLFFMDVRELDAEGRPLILGRQRIVGSRYSFDI